MQIVVKQALSALQIVEVKLDTTSIAFVVWKFLIVNTEAIDTTQSTSNKKIEIVHSCHILFGQGLLFR